MSRIRRILHPSDFSRASAKAFAKAVEMAKANLVGDGYVSPKIYEDLEASARAWGQKQLNRLLAKARKAGARAKGMLMEGVPHEQIVRAARFRKAGLIVIGTHGRTGLAKFVLGSVAGRVVSMASCPVMTVRGK
jgi:nucleotide-binding universal stress UspA family protein